MPIYKPYTYLIGWSKHDRWYYGCEYGSISKTANPQNLWTTYFTSSKYVKDFRCQHGEPDIIQIRKTFNTEENTRNWEKRVLIRLKVVNDRRWLNEGVGSIHFSEIVRKRMGDWQRNKPKTEKARLNMSKAQRGKKRNPHTSETKKKIAQSHLKIEPWNKGSKTKSIECPKCHLLIPYNNKRWHFDACIPRNRPRTRELLSVILLPSIR